MTKDSLLNNVVVPIAREGWPFIAIFSLVSLVLYFVYAPLGWVGLVLASVR